MQRLYSSVKIYELVGFRLQVKYKIVHKRQMYDVESCLTGFIYLKSFDPVQHKHCNSTHYPPSHIEGVFQHARNGEIFWLFDILRQQ